LHTESTEAPEPRLANVGLILVGPRYPENIGAAARIAYNFGIPEITVVAEKHPDQERMLKMATHKAAHLIKKMRLVASTREAAAPYHFIIGTTARHGRQRLRQNTPRLIMEQIRPLAATPGTRIGLMFGPENTGLTNEDLDFCQFSSTIPTADFSSLNLAQAVAIHCYELYMAIAAARIKSPAPIEYANSFDLEGMYGHVTEALSEVTFLDDANQIYWMRSIRQFLGRVRLTKKEASLIRGICRKFLWHSRNRMRQ
jgi:tRNA/rRNA methyltransferase